MSPTHRDDECFNEACGWDGDDCDSKWELKRTLVFSPGDGYERVHDTEYTLVGPNGEKRTLTMEEGLRWEGADEKSVEEDEFDWRKMLSDDDDDDVDEDDDEVVDDDEEDQDQHQDDDTSVTGGDNSIEDTTSRLDRRTGGEF